MDDTVLIGVDGGASKVLAHRVEILDSPLRFTPTEPTIEISYESSGLYETGFEPVPLDEQLTEHRSGSIHQKNVEEKREAAVLDSFVQAISGLGVSDSSRPLVIGIGLPGLKTPDKRGISAMANGPRMPKFLDKLETLLAEKGFSGVRPVHGLGSDADFCGLGEHWGDTGAMRGVRNAYYLGIGTGVADAMLLSGVIVPFDQTKSWMAKTWEIMYSDEHSYENMVSAQGMQRRYSDQTGVSLDDLNRREIYPWQIFERAMEGEPEAKNVVAATVEALAQLLRLRIVTLARGAENVRLVDASRALSAEHEYLGGVFDRIVIGQRLGDIWRHHEFDAIFRDPVEERLSDLIRSARLAKDIEEAYLSKTGRVRQDLMVPSVLRNAPALGAAVDAYLHWTQ